MDNIERFNLLVGLILTDLYKNFPESIRLRAAYYTQEAGLYSEPGPDGKTFAVTEKEGLPAASAIEWLIDEGFVRTISEKGDYAWDAKGCVLTHKGLRLVSVPSSIQDSTSLGDDLLKATRDGLTDGTKKVVGGIVKGVLVEGGKIALRAALEGLVQGGL